MVKKWRKNCLGLSRSEGKALYYILHRFLPNHLGEVNSSRGHSPLLYPCRTAEWTLQGQLSLLAALM